MIGRILFWWGAAICSLIVLAAATSLLLEAYIQQGVLGGVIAAAILSAVPALCLGLVWSDK